MKKTVFTGAATAIVTPLNENGVDYESFGRLIDWQISEGINAIVVAGTTGEGSTLSDEEHRQVLKFAVDRIDGKVPVIAGTGSNDTAYAIDLTKYACSIDQRGEREHFSDRRNSVARKRKNGHLFGKRRSDRAYPFARRKRRYLRSFKCPSPRNGRDVRCVFQRRLRKEPRYAT